MGTNLISDVQRLRAAAAATTPSCEPLPRPPWLSDAVWPFSTVSLRVDDENIAVTSAGSGPALLYVHTGLCSIIWRDVMSLLAVDFRCVCLDAPGTGLSERLPPGRIDLNHSAQAVTAVVTQLELEELVLRSRSGWLDGARRGRRSARTRARDRRGEHIRLAPL